jgi:hypothetical protein
MICLENLNDGRISQEINACMSTMEYTPCKKWYLYAPRKSKPLTILSERVSIEEKCNIFFKYNSIETFPKYPFRWKK